MRRALAITLLAGGSLLGWSAVYAGAATVDDAGWWDRNADALLPQIDPPPDGAIRVGNDPAGASAIAAVRLQLDDGEDDPTLVLRVVGDPVPEGAAFQACPATSEWTGATGAPFSEAPGPTIGGGSAPSTPSFTPSPSSGGSTSPAGPSVTVPGVETPAAGAGSPTVTTPIDPEQAVAPPLADASTSSKRWIGLVTAAAIIGLGVYLWRADRARAVMTAGPVLGGLGPFVRERSGPAPEVA